jgi:ribose transport system ATP-binding protein
VSTTATASALRLDGVSKQFNGNYALSDVSVEVRRGEVHALLGANGSGKSTLIKILSGYHQAESGAEAWIGGQRLNLGSAADAHRCGLRVIHQDLGLVDDLSILDNIALGGVYQHRYWISDRRESGAVSALLARYDVPVDPQRLVGALSSAEKTMVAIVRALRDLPDTGGLLILDEPTASLPEKEAGQVFDLVRSVSAQSGGVVYVTHRLDEVFELADRVTVLRDGRVAATRDVSEVTHDELIELIVGRPVDKIFPTAVSRTAESVVLSVSGLSGPQVVDASFDVHGGEIVGVVGLTGSGADELLPLIFGAGGRHAGEVRAGRELVKANSPSDALAKGLAFAPSDRGRLSTIQSWTLSENLTLPQLEDITYRTWLSVRAERAESAHWLREFDVRPSEPSAVISALSGGNQQKTVLAKWLRCRPLVLMLQEPTAGVDVGARSHIYDAINSAATDGAGVLISSSDVDEICGLCSRVLVTARGRLVATLTGDDISPTQITAEMLRDRPGRMAEEEAEDEC